MCGIAGILSKKADLNQEMIEQMTCAVAHRGPDAQGIFLNEQHTVGLGHRRLSILDLSTASNQPMHSMDGRYVIVFNGEIYNFKKIKLRLEREGCTFKTESDTEVLLIAFDQWGMQKMLDQLEGMFAFAIYDQQENKLSLSRDRVGKKPLYYYSDDEVFIFASEIKSILAYKKVKKQVNHTALQQFLQLGYIPEPATAWQQIHKFPSGSFGEVNEGLQLNVQKYWQPEKLIHDGESKNEAQTLQQFKNILTDAVSKRLISDVPLGALLSGGTDSSLVCAIASTLTTQKLKTFTIGFEDKKFNESDYAEKVAARLGTDHHTFYLRESEALDMVEKYLDHFDEPFADSSAIPTMLVSEHARKHVTVALTGDGGDELFLGYGSYTWAERIKQWGSVARPFTKLGLPSRKMKKAEAMFDTVTQDQVRAHIFSQEQGFFSAKEVKLLTGANTITTLNYSDAKELSLKSESEKQAFFDLNYYLKDDLLVKVDESSMYFGLEARCPLLDPQLIEFALNLKPEYKIRSSVQKYLPKKLLTQFLPEELVYRKKWGFGVPLAKWLKGDLHYLIDQYLNQSVVEEFGFVKFAGVSDLLKRFEKGEHELYHKLWVLITLHYWLVKHAR